MPWPLAFSAPNPIPSLQMAGKPVDRRADIWAFGALLYEIVTGRPAFGGGTIADILAAVLNRDPDWEAVPSGFRPLLRRCLEKDPAKRLRDIGDLDLLLPNSTREPAPRRRMSMIAVAGLSVGLGALAVSLWMRAPSPAAWRSWQNP